MKIGLFFGSFNPVHHGHMILANFMLEFTDLDKIWFVVSPHNPLKEKSSLLADHHRLEMVTRAIGDHLNLKASDIEFRLPQPSFTINTLAHLSEKYPDIRFALIMGADNLQSLHKWKNYEQILEHYDIYVYPRPGLINDELLKHPHIHLTDAPLINISSTFIRQGIKAGKDMRYFIPTEAFQYLEEMHFYKK
ncbi:MAG: nicotinate-nucleotide adenylyltransferase [Bacteroidetes bacterium]|nr:nicotinate-nucleotide adenylyltransferase [Bacteroidota bacterium]